jgi:hypothetical protein
VCNGQVVALGLVQGSQRPEAAGEQGILLRAKVQQQGVLPAAQAAARGQRAVRGCMRRMVRWSQGASSSRG